MINFRILRTVACYLVVAGLLVATTQLASRPKVWTEHIAPQGVASQTRLPHGIRVAVRGNHVEISLPYCTTSYFSEPFFIHVFPYWEGTGPNAKPIVTEFSLMDRKPRWTTKEGITYCNYHESFKGQDPQEIIIGQLQQVENQPCCKVLWSRSYFPDAQ